MSIHDRVGWMFLGCVIGFILGYIVRSLQELKEELHEVEEDVNFNKSERGSTNSDILLKFGLLLVILITVVGALKSQKASNDAEHTLHGLDHVSSCNQQYLSKTIMTLNERTTYTKSQAASNVNLQKSQAKFLGVILLRPPTSDSARQKALETYFQALTNFLDVSQKSAMKVKDNPFPTIDQLSKCLSNR